MSRHRLEAYLDKVFGFSALVGALPEGREFPQHPWKKVFDAVFLGAARKIPASFRSRPSAAQERLRNASGQLATTPSATRWSDNLPNRCSRSDAKSPAA